MSALLKLGLLISILTLTTEAFAAGGEGIPWGKLIAPQVINFCVFAGALYFFLGAKVKAYFASRLDGFEEQVAKAKAAKIEAEQLHDDIKGRISDIESNAQKDLEKAKLDASIMAKKILEEARVIAKRIEDEGQSTINQELYRNVSALKVEFLDRSFGEADEFIGSNVDAEVDKNLQASFVSKAKQVQL